MSKVYHTAMNFFVETQRLIHIGLEILFPDHCIGCNAAREILCERCCGALPRTRTSPASWIICIYEYRERVMQDSIRALKYKNHRRLACIFGQKMYEECLPEITELLPLLSTEHEKIIVMPIPATRKRHRTRGYNQAELIARAFTESDLFNTKIFELRRDLLYKTRDTQSQVDIKDKKLRLLNIKDTMRVRSREALENKIILLIDDVATTGATLTEARRACKEAGAREVLAITLAH